MFVALGDHVDETAPFVFQPYRAEIFGLFPEYNHHLCRFQSVINVRFILFRNLITQSDTAVKHLIAFILQEVVKFHRIDAILRTVDAIFLIAVLIADEHIIRRFFTSLIQPFNTDFFDLFRLLLIGRFYVRGCTRNRLLHVFVLQEGIFRNVVAGRHFFPFLQIGYVQNTGFRERFPPVRFMVIFIL